MDSIKATLERRVEFLATERTKELTEKYDIEKAPTSNVPSSLGKAELETTAVELLNIYKQQKQVVAVPIRAFAEHLVATDKQRNEYLTAELLKSQLFEQDLSCYISTGDVYAIPTDEFFENQKVPIRETQTDSEEDLRRKIIHPHD